MAYECELIECYPGFGPTVTTDGNMEDDPTTNWPGTGANVAEETVNVHTGCLALEVTATAAPGSARQSLTVEAGHRYRIGVWGLCDAGTDQWRVTFYIAGSVVWTSDWHANAVSWEEEVKLYRIPDGITTLEIRLEVDQIGDVVNFDDVTATRESPVPMTTIDLQYNVALGMSLLNRGIQPGRPERVSLYGGRLEIQLVRQDDGKRVIPLRLVAEGDDGEDLIDRVNALEEMLRHAGRYHTEGIGGEVFLRFKIDDATHTVWFPVSEGEIETALFYEQCGGEPDDMIRDLPVSVTCEPYWESDFTYDLSNLLDNPGFEEWNDGICDSEPDCWTDYESIAAGTATNQQETDEVEEGCEALRIEVIAVNNGDFKGVLQNIQARLRADTEYTALVWVQNAAITGGNIVVHVVGSVSGVLGTALSSGAANANYTQYSCQFTPAAADVAGWVRIQAYIIATATPCTGIVHVDKMQVMEASNVPTGWMSSSYLVNHYDRDANEVTLLSVCDIPGETEAETSFGLAFAEALQLFRVAKRTRDDPCNFQWQLIPCEAYTTAEGGAGGACTPGLTDAGCLDSDKIVDANSPSGSRIEVSFAGNQTMQLRCYWDITGTDLVYYSGQYQLMVLVDKSADTDVVEIQIETWDHGPYWIQQGLESRVVPVATANEWRCLDDWAIFSFPISSHDGQFDTANRWRIRLLASVTGAAAWDTLRIAGVYLIPIDETYLLSGLDSVSLAAGITANLKKMDGERGFFAHNPATFAYYGNISTIGGFPSLSPELENYFYVSKDGVEAGADLAIAETVVVSVTYRPRGIFLRGANP